MAAEGLYGGDALKGILTALQLKAARKGRAVPSALAASFCRRKTLWRQNSLICFRTGTQKRIPRCCRRRSCREHTGRSGVGSHKKVWWRCPAGHSYDSVVKSRVQGTGRPVCAGRVVLPDENSLAARYPALAAEWDTEKNASLLPTQVAAGTLKKVWWKCPKGHSYFASVASRVRGSGCPACGGKTVVPGENDLATQYPLLAAQWDAAKNGALTPETVLPGSNRRVWWRCEDGHSYPAAISHRVRSGSDCPFCANRKVLPGFNDLAAIEPVVASQWHPTRNGSLTPQQVTPGSSRRVWWLCENGHAWRAVVSSRTGK